MNDSFFDEGQTSFCYLMQIFFGSNLWDAFVSLKNIP